MKDITFPSFIKTCMNFFQDPEVDIVRNLARPYEHYNVTLEALNAGKHVYSEKPLAASVQEEELVGVEQRERAVARRGA